MQGAFSSTEETERLMEWYAPARRLLQRRMSIGYGRAARIIDQLEQAGILKTRIF